MEFNNLYKWFLDRYGPFFDESELESLFEAAKKDFKNVDEKPGLESSWIISTCNEVFEKNYRTISVPVLKKYKKVFSTFTKDEFVTALHSAKDDDFHKGSNYKFCTLEYFSRIEQVDKWLNNSKEKTKSDFNVPKFNVKEKF